MPAVRLLPKAYVASALPLRDCVRVRDYKHCSLWKHESGFHFTVPREGPDDQTDEMTFNMLLKEIERHREIPSDADLRATD